ncbi:phage antirepressor Ant [Mycetocola reblochoni]|uniref:Phage antirepressor protein n=3 Tax=Mycetocola reblochoni TaxID=331618 RepID=A0A1R4JPG2_9MICO|nr:phage antirepressor KilAC domain-containing protein [Mycetocola reblochoni]RLP68390.1 phage antirepressor Ant [Mycetocola reblochoni]SJN33862.1 Phage antirepressor protein [Mycetocola reblochoni REB411]
MSNNIVPFTFDQHQVRVVAIEGEPWFVLADLTRVLGLSQYRADRLDDGVIQNHPIPDRLGRIQNATIVSEAGMYEVVIRSDKPEAAAFRRWITSEVLPQIRKTGTYGRVAEITKSDLARMVLESEAERAQLAARVEADAPKVLFADSVATSDATILVGELAKILRGNGIEIGQNRLFAKLRDEGFLIKREGTDYNMPTQKAMELELFKIKETAITHSDGHVTVNKTPKVTGKGQSYFINRYTPTAA